MPIDPAEISESYILIEGIHPVGRALLQLEREGGYAWWHLIVDLGNGHYGVIQFGGLAELPQARGMAFFREPLGSLVGREIPEATVIEQSAMGTEGAKDLAYERPGRVVVVARAGRCIGVLHVGSLQGDLEHDLLQQQWAAFKESNRQDYEGWESALDLEEVGEREAPPRYANVDFVDAETLEHCAPTDPLAVGAPYRLRIDIGDERETSAVVNAEEFPFPDQVLPRSTDGHWLDVVITSSDFDVASSSYALFLPEGGDSWVCGCHRDGAHSCTPGERDPYLYVPLTSPGDPGEATLRIGLYYENNLVQSQRLTAQVGVEIPPGKRGYQSVIDYSLTRALADVARLPARTLNIFTNENADGSHRVILVNKQRVFHDTLDAKTVKDALEAARAGLHDTHRKLEHKAKTRELPDGTEVVVRPAEYRNLLKTLKVLEVSVQHAKNKEDFLADLRRLANLGFLLYQTLFLKYPKSQDLLCEILEEQATIQACRVEDGDAALLFPWALIYDIFLSSDPSQHRVCRVLEDWRPGTPVVDPGATRCPYHDEIDHDVNLICPFGFWGIKHIVEQPPSLRQGRKLETKIVQADTKAKMAVGLSLDLDEPQEHVKALREKLAQRVEILDEDSKEEILDMLGDAELELVYFFCHGRRLRLSEGAQPVPFLEVGKREKITTGDIMVWQRRRWPKPHWQGKWPLVFINGCHTAELTPDAMVSFVDAFIAANASGVIGTEVTVEQGLASEAALLFFTYLLQENAEGHGNVGQAIRRMRLEFLSRGNLMGLAYTPYCSASLHLE